MAIHLHDFPQSIERLYENGALVNAAAPNEYDIGDSVTLKAVFLAGATVGSIVASQNTLTVRDANFSAADPILVAGAGPLGGDLVTTVSSLSGILLVLAAVARTDVAGVLVGRPTDTTVACKVTQPDGSEVTAAVTHAATGTYTASFAPAQAGEHFYAFTGTGALAGKEEGFFVVRTPEVP